MRPTLEDAISLAAKAHRGRKDKAGAAYILHPVRVMLRMRTKEERIVAVSHDVIEDTSIAWEIFEKPDTPKRLYDPLTI